MLQIAASVIIAGVSVYNTISNKNGGAAKWTRQSNLVWKPGCVFVLFFFSRTSPLLLDVCLSTEVAVHGEGKALPMGLLRGFFVVAVVGVKWHVGYDTC